MPQRDPVKEKYWRRLLRQWQRSGLTARQFCDQQAISQPSLYAWRREIARRDRQPTTMLPTAHRADRAALTPAASPTFVKLALEATAPPAIEIVTADGRLLRVRPGFDADLLRQLLRLLEEAVC
jgi:hypothetical protein